MAPSPERSVERDRAIYEGRALSVVLVVIAAVDISLIYPHLSSYGRGVDDGITVGLVISAVMLYALRAWRRRS